MSRSRLVRCKRGHRRHARRHQRRNREQPAATRHRIDRAGEKGDGGQKGDDVGGKLHGGGV
jgi:hypothetical protein